MMVLGIMPSTMLEVSVAMLKYQLKRCNWQDRFQEEI